MFLKPAVYERHIDGATREPRTHIKRARRPIEGDGRGSLLSPKFDLLEQWRNISGKHNILAVSKVVICQWQY